jgi:hypothetical protein
MAPRKPQRATQSSSPCSVRCITFCAFAALFAAWLRFTATSDVAVTRGQFKTVEQYDRQAAAVAAAARQEPAATVAAVEQPAPVAYRQHEVQVSLKPPTPLATLLPAEKKVDAPAECRAREHTELEGGVVKWGDHNRVSSATECCASCSEHAQQAKAGSKPCNERRRRSNPRPEQPAASAAAPLMLAGPRARGG